MKRTGRISPGPKQLAAAAILGVIALLIGVSISAARGSSAEGAQATIADDRREIFAADMQVVLVTGSTDGLGREVALRLGASGAHVIVHGRNRERGEAVVAEIEGGPGSARFYAADLSTIDGVRRLGEEILRDYDRLDLLVNNAGIWLNTPERQVSPDGHEMHMAVNYLSGFLLTRMLLPTLIASAPSRIINVASTAQNPIDFDDVMIERNYSGGRGYGQSKLAQILFTVDLAEELEGSGVLVYSLHPATLMETTLVAQAGVQARSTIDEGADAVMNLTTIEDIASGQYFNGMRPMQANAQAYDADARARLHAIAMELTGAP
jgi:NAD(P)-dependent dehydrogenase (short-subunit alcohol dehydrogenase family)